MALNGHSIVYIAGPMTAHAGNDYNYAAFDAAERLWKDNGWLVESPTKIGRDWGYKKDYAFYLKHAIVMLLRSDAIALLPGWQESTVAILELNIARSLSYSIYDADTQQPITIANGLYGTLHPSEQHRIDDHEADHATGACACPCLWLVKE